MSAKGSRALRAGVERLERRETPSTHAAAATVLQLGGTGTATVTASMPIVNAQSVATAISGNNRGLGNYTGALNLFYEFNGRFGAGNGVVAASNGDHINLSLTSQIHIPTIPGGGNTGVIHFKVTGGSGAFANATGHGVLVGNVNYSFPYTYTLQGRIRE
jgi:hypothetical protein